MSSAMQWDPQDSIGKLALEVSRIAHEGLGSTVFHERYTAFRQQVEQGCNDLETQVRSVTRLFMALTREDGSRQMSVAEVQRAGFCLIWLAGTYVSEWSLLRLCMWGESLPPQIA